MSGQRDASEPPPKRQATLAAFLVRTQPDPNPAAPAPGNNPPVPDVVPAPQAAAAPPVGDAQPVAGPAAAGAVPAMQHVWDIGQFVGEGVIANVTDE